MDIPIHNGTLCNLNNNLSIEKLGLPNTYETKISALRLNWGDICSPNLTLKPKTQLEVLFNSNITWNCYFRLRSNLAWISVHFKNNISVVKSNFHNLFSNIKKIKSDKFYSIISFLNESNNNWAKKKCELANLGNLELYPLSLAISQNFVMNSMKIVYFKFLNNTLILNGQLAKFDESIDPRCNVCKRRAFIVPYIELKSHLFFFCDGLNEIRSHFLTLLKDSNVADIQSTDLEASNLSIYTSINSFKLSLLFLIYVNYIYLHRKNIYVTDIGKFAEFIYLHLRIFSELSPKAERCFQEVMRLCYHE